MKTMVGICAEMPWRLLPCWET